MLRLMDERLGNIPWLVGDEFTAADIMTVFILTTMRSFYEFEEILTYLKRVSEREGFKKARAEADPEMELMIVVLTKEGAIY